MVRAKPVNSLTNKTQIVDGATDNEQDCCQYQDAGDKRRWNSQKAVFGERGDCNQARGANRQRRDDEVA
jgi:hypothetical protein